MTASFGVLASTACDVSDWTAGSWHKCVFEPVPALHGEALFGLFVGGTVILSMYHAGGGDMAAPAVVTILFGGVLAATLPAGLVGVAWAVAFLGFVAGLVAVGQRYVMNPATGQF